MDQGQELRHLLPDRAVAGHRRRGARPRQAAAVDRGQWRAAAEQQYLRPDLRDRPYRQLCQPFHDALSGRRDPDWDAIGGRRRVQAAELPQARRPDAAVGRGARRADPAPRRVPGLINRLMLASPMVGPGASDRRFTRYGNGRARTEMYALAQCDSFTLWFRVPCAQARSISRLEPPCTTAAPSFSVKTPPLAVRLKPKSNGSMPAKVLAS